MIGEGLATVLSGFPRRSETFALAELPALEADGMAGAIFATKPVWPYRPDRQPCLLPTNFTVR